MRRYYTMESNSRDYSWERIKRIVCVSILIFSSLLLLDIVMNDQVSEEEIQHKVYYKYRSGTIRSTGGTRTVIGIVTDKKEYPLRRPPLYNDSEEGERILVYKTRILGQVRKIRLNDKEYVDAAYSIYAFYYLFPFICITSGFFAFLLDKTRSSHFDFFLILSSVIAVFLIISMFTNSII